MSAGGRAKPQGSHKPGGEDHSQRREPYSQIVRGNYNNPNQAMLQTDMNKPANPVFSQGPNIQNPQMGPPSVAPAANQTVHQGQPMQNVAVQQVVNQQGGQQRSYVNSSHPHTYQPRAPRNMMQNRHPVMAQNQLQGPQQGSAAPGTSNHNAVGNVMSMPQHVYAGFPQQMTQMQPQTTQYSLGSNHMNQMQQHQYHHQHRPYSNHPSATTPQYGQHYVLYQPGMWPLQLNSFGNPMMQMTVPRVGPNAAPNNLQGMNQNQLSVNDGVSTEVAQLQHHQSQQQILTQHHHSMQHTMRHTQPAPLQQIPQPPLAQNSTVQPAPYKKRERKGAEIRDPESNRVLTEEELKSTAPGSSSLNQSETNPSDNQISSSTSTNSQMVQASALEFMEKVTSASLPDNKLESSPNEVDDTDSSMTVTSTVNYETIPNADDSDRVVKESEPEIVETITENNEKSDLNSSVTIDSTPESENVSSLITAPEVDDTNSYNEDRPDQDTCDSEEVSNSKIENNVLQHNGEIDETPLRTNSPISSVTCNIEAKDKRPKKSKIQESSEKKVESSTEAIQVIVNESNDQESSITADEDKTPETQLIPNVDDVVAENSAVHEEIENGHKVEEDSKVLSEGESNKNQDNTRVEVQKSVRNENEATKPDALQSVPIANDVRRKDSGKYEYTRDFLLSLKDATLSLQMPVDIPNLDIVFDKPRQPNENNYTNNRRVGGERLDQFLPGFIKAQSGRPDLIGRMNQRHSQPGRVPDKGRKVISTSITKEVNIHKSENAWKPGHKVNDAVLEDEKKTEDILKKIRGILNKLTPQKYELLLKQISQLEIDTEERLSKTLDLIFEKAVDEPSFCIQYANLCKHLSTMNVVKMGEQGKEEVKFQRLLLSRCQQEFESDVYKDIDITSKEEIINKCEDEDKRKVLKSELEEEKRKARKRSLGNIKFIGELYKLHMLKGNIMMSCIGKLCQEKDEESLECLCTLLRTIGAQLERECKERDMKGFSNVSLEPYINQMRKVVEERSVSARVRFMIQDVLDMRKDDWRVRKIQDENKPKTIDQIHAEVRNEEERQHRELQEHSRKRYEDKDKRKGGRPQEEAGWTPVGRKSQSSQPVLMPDLRGLQQKGEVQLGPSNLNWGMGSGVGQRGSQSKSSSMHDDSKSGSRFTLLSSDDPRKYKQNSRSSNVPSRDSSKGRSNQPSLRNKIPSSEKSYGRPTPSPTPYDRKPSSRSSSMEKNSASSSRSSSIRRETPIQENSNSKLRGNNISPDEMLTKSEVMIKEYLNVRNLGEAIEDVTLSCNATNIHSYVAAGFNIVLDKTSQSDRRQIGILYSKLINDGYVSDQHFYKGLNNILENAADISIDVPKMWVYLGEAIAPIFEEIPDDRRSPFFRDALKSSTDSGHAGELMAEIVKAATNNKTTQEVKHLWEVSSLRWEDFLKLKLKEDVDEFLKKKNISINSSMKPSSSGNKMQDFYDVVTSLVKKDSPDDAILQYINSNFAVDDTTDTSFTSALVKAVIRGCIEEASVPTEHVIHYTLNDSRLGEKCPLLAKFIGGDQVHELAALTALQLLMDEMQHPSKLLYSIFEKIHEDVISADAFKQWENTEQNLQGKPMAIMSVKSFLTWLNETEDSMSDS